MFCVPVLGRGPVPFWGRVGACFGTPPRFGTGTDLGRGLSILYLLPLPTDWIFLMYPQSLRFFVAAEILDSLRAVSSESRLLDGQHSPVCLSACTARAINTLRSRFPRRWSDKNPVSRSRTAIKAYLFWSKSFFLKKRLMWLAIAPPPTSRPTGGGQAGSPATASSPSA